MINEFTAGTFVTWIDLYREDGTGIKLIAKDSSNVAKELLDFLDQEGSFFIHRPSETWSKAFGTSKSWDRTEFKYNDLPQAIKDGYRNNL